MLGAQISFLSYKMQYIPIHVFENNVGALLDFEVQNKRKPSRRKKKHMSL